MALDAVVPAIIIAIYALAIDGIFSHQSMPDGRKNKYTLKERLWELNCGILGLVLSQGLAFVITGALKNATGKPRPDLIDRCRPEPGTQDPSPYGLSNSTICLQQNHAILKDGFRSFPSGHSSCRFTRRVLYYNSELIPRCSCVCWTFLSLSLSCGKTTYFGQEGRGLEIISRHDTNSRCGSDCYLTHHGRSSSSLRRYFWELPWDCNGVWGLSPVLSPRQRIMEKRASVPNPQLGFRAENSASRRAPGIARSGCGTAPNEHWPYR